MHIGKNIFHRIIKRNCLENVLFISHIEGCSAARVAVKNMFLCLHYITMRN